MSKDPVKTEQSIAGTPSDEDLVSSAIDGKGEAFEGIMRRYNQRCFRIARGYLNSDEDAMDVVQEAYVRAFTHLGQYTGPDNFSAWLGRIVRNEALMYLRKQKNVVFLPCERMDELPPQIDMTKTNLTEPEHRAEGQQVRQLIEDAANRLPLDFRVIFMLRGIEQLSIEETCKITGVKAATVKTRYHRARKIVQEHIRHRVDAEEWEAFSFAGQRCNYIVKTVLERLQTAGAVP